MKPDPLKKYIFIVPLVFILVLAYWRNTYLINPNFNGDPWIIEINSLDPQIPSKSLVSIKSIVVFWFLFFAGNVMLFTALFSSFQKVKTMGIFYILLSGLSVLFFGIDTLLTKSTLFFSFASIVKNFILSPLFTALSYLVLKIFTGLSGHPDHY